MLLVTVDSNNRVLNRDMSLWQKKDDTLIKTRSLLISSNCNCFEKNVQRMYKD